MSGHKEQRAGRVRLAFARVRWPAAALLGVALVLWLVLVAPRLLVPAASDASLQDVSDAAKRHELQDSRLKLQNDVRTTLLQGLGGLAVLLGALFTYRQVQTSRRQLDHTIQADRAQHELDRQGQITERFTRAIDQLGHEGLEVRLGGIYALERIANDSPEDRATIAEVLTAFVRGHAPWPPTRKGQPKEDMPLHDLPELRVWAADVQAALTVLGRRKPPIGPAQPLDLSFCDLRRADLSGAQLQDVNLFGARLQRASLFGAQLQEGNLWDAKLEGAVCDSKTGWPDRFDLQRAGVFLIDYPSE